MDGDEPPRKRIVLDLDWLPEPVAGPHTVTFLPSRRQATVEHGYSVFEAAKGIGLYVPSTCGGKGTCGRCRVRVVAGCDPTSGPPDPSATSGPPDPSATSGPPDPSATSGPPDPSAAGGPTGAGAAGGPTGAGAAGGPTGAGAAGGPTGAGAGDDSTGSAVRPPTAIEKRFISRADLARDVRLACRLRVEGDIVVIVPRETD